MAELEVGDRKGNTVTPRRPQALKRARHYPFNRARISLTASSMPVKSARLMML